MSKSQEIKVSKYVLNNHANILTLTYGLKAKFKSIEDSNYALKSQNYRIKVKHLIYLILLV